MCYTGLNPNSLRFQVLAFLFVRGVVGSAVKDRNRVVSLINNCAIGDGLTILLAIRWVILKSQDTLGVVLVRRWPHEQLASVILEEENIVWLENDQLRVLFDVLKHRLPPHSSNNILAGREQESFAQLFIQNLVSLSCRSLFLSAESLIYRNSILHWSSAVKNVSKFNARMATGLRANLSAKDPIACYLASHVEIGKHWEDDVFSSRKKINSLFQTCSKYPLPPGKFICLHLKLSVDTTQEVRFSEKHHHYIPAITYLKSLGYQVILMGSKGDSEFLRQRVPELYDLLEDYAGSEFQSIEHDLWLVEKCSFFIGNASGPTNYCDLFSIPMLRLNATFITWAEVKGHQLFYPKNFFDRSLGRNLSWQETLERPFIYTNSRSEHEKEGVQAEDISAEQALAAVIEFERFALLNNRDFQPSPRQIKFRKSLKPWHLYLFEVVCYPCDSYLKSLDYGSVAN